MLRSFRVANHKSIRDEQELLLMPVYDKDRTALPITAIYGANASGKSNLLDALRFVQEAVLDSYQRWAPGQLIPRHTFRLDQTHRTAPSWYVLEMVIDGVRWTYGFEVDDTHVREEWLYTYPQVRRRLIFERDDKGIRFGSTVELLRGQSRVLEQLTRRNALFLSLAAQTGMTDVLPVYKWLNDCLLFPPQRNKGLDDLIGYLEANPDRRSDVATLVRAADMGVSGVDLRAPADDAVQAATTRELEAQDQVARSLAGDGTNVEAIQELQEALTARLEAMALARQPRLRLTHAGADEPFDPSDESAGTLSWLSLIPHVLTALARGRTLVIDELDASLHPRLLVRLLELFRDPKINMGGGQLIFTTHDATLLGTSFGMPVLERDEVWFVDKTSDGATELTALADFHPRKEENTERRYLGGSYGAVPAVYSDTFVKRLLEARQESSSAAS